MSQVTPTERQAIPAPESMQNCATRVAASTLGILAGLLGLVHGYLETRFKLRRNSPTIPKSPNSRKSLFQLSSTT